MFLSSKGVTFNCYRSSLKDHTSVSVIMKNGEGSYWVVTVHCSSHWLELSIADTLKSTVFSSINEMLQNV